MSNFELIYDDGKQTSYGELLELAHHGYSVMRSPHVPLSTSNLGVAMLGLETVLYGDTFLGASALSKEEVRNNPLSMGDEIVAEDPGVKTMTRFIDARLEGFSATTLVNLHAEASRLAVGEAVTTWHEFAAVHRDLYANVIDVALDQGHRFTDSVNARNGVWADWRKNKTITEDVLDVAEATDTFQAVATLDCKLACMFAAQAISSGRQEVYHLAGRDMLSYMPAKSKRIEALITGLQQRGFLEKIKVVIVPTENTKIISTKADADILNEMWRLSGSRDAESKRSLKKLLQAKELRDAMARDISVFDVVELGGEGVVVLEEAIKTPIAHIQHRLR